MRFSRVTIRIHEFRPNGPTKKELLKEMMRIVGETTHRPDGRYQHYGFYKGLRSTC